MGETKKQLNKQGNASKCWENVLINDGEPDQRPFKVTFAIN